MYRIALVLGKLLPIPVEYYNFEISIFHNYRLKSFLNVLSAT